MNARQIKQYLFDNNLMYYVLNQIGCNWLKCYCGYGSKNYNFDDLQLLNDKSLCSSVPRPQKITCSNPDGDNKQAIVLFCDSPYLNIIDCTRNLSKYDDNGNGKYDIITLIQHYENISFSDAMILLHNILGLEAKSSYTVPLSNNSDEEFEDDEDDKIETIPESELDKYSDLPYIDWIREGIMGWTWERFGLRYSYKKKRVIIPLRHWETGQLIGINSRTVIKDYKEYGIHKYYITPNYKKRLNLYGLFQNREYIEQAKYIVIVEGEKSVLKRDSRNDKTLVALSGHSISDEQIRIINSLDIDEVIIAVDKDIPIQESRFMCEKFCKYKKVSYIFDKWDILGEKDSPADATNKDYQFLFDNRIPYDESEHAAFVEAMSSR